MVNIKYIGLQQPEENQPYFLYMNSSEQYALWSIS